MADDYKVPERDHKSDITAEWAPRINLHVKTLKQKGHIPMDIDDGDLHSAGMEGLMDAFHRHSDKKGNFMAFADHRIKGKMLDHVKASGGANNVPGLFRDQAKATAAAQDIKPSTEED